MLLNFGICTVYIGENSCIFSDFLGVFTSLQAQIRSRDNYNYLDFQGKSHYFGMAFQFFRLPHQSIYFFFIGNDSIRIAEANAKVVSISTWLPTSKWVSILISGFYRVLLFIQVFLFNGLEEKQVESVFFEMPFSLRYKSQPYKDKRVFGWVDWNILWHCQ